MPPAGPDSVHLPEGVLWRRAIIQVITRLGVRPGDRVLVLAPPERDLAVALADRQPRVQILQLGGPGAHPFGWTGPGPAVARIQADPFHAPFPDEAVDAIALLFPLPLLDIEAHQDLIDEWAPCLLPFGKWTSLLALDGPRDPRLTESEAHLKEAGFEKVRSMRLALGRMGATLFLQTARWPGSDAEE